jgi:hypothetical protein
MPLKESQWGIKGGSIRVEEAIKMATVGEGLIKKE